MLCDRNGYRSHIRSKVSDIFGLLLCKSLIFRNFHVITTGECFFCLLSDLSNLALRKLRDTALVLGRIHKHHLCHNTYDCIRRTCVEISECGLVLYSVS